MLKEAISTSDLERARTAEGFLPKENFEFELAWYVYRKAVLDFFQAFLKTGRANAWRLENAIQSLIFPGGVDYERHNLWIIDERLFFCRYLSLFFSEDLSGTGELPGSTVFDRPVVFVEGDLPFSFAAVVKFERSLPRPGEKNPIDHVYSCVRQMLEGKALIRKGRPVFAMQNTPFHCYILCDLTEEIREQAANADLRSTPDGLGYFGYNNTYGCNIEIISYDKAVQDARKRNRVFEKVLKRRRLF